MKMDKEKCSRCGNYCFYWLKFQSLDGEPIVCRDCIETVLALPGLKVVKEELMQQYMEPECPPVK